jgi:cytochrome c biogenesis protein CcdA
MLLILLSFIAVFLSVLAPCILPLLPIIIGGGFSGIQDKRRPYIITISLVVSLILFTILLKVSTVLIGITPSTWSYISGAIIIALGLTMLFPHYWDLFIGKIGFQSKSQELLGSAGQAKSSALQAVLIGVALGPVFSSCSPMYAWVVATVLPESSIKGVVYLAFYCLGLSFALLLISLLGRRLLEKIKWVSNPNGWFQRSIAILFIIVGLMIVTGFQKDIQTYLVEKDVFNVKRLEEIVVPD